MAATKDGSSDIELRIVQGPGIRLINTAIG